MRVLVTSVMFTPQRYVYRTDHGSLHQYINAVVVHITSPFRIYDQNRDDQAVISPASTAIS
jgi:hypothetical protein